jgi:hypothetical protein
MKFFTNSTKVKSSFRPTFDTLENRLVPAAVSIGVTYAANMSAILRTGNPPVIYGPDPTWFNNNLSDSSMRSIAQTDYNRDQGLTRNDMLGLFSQAEANGVISDAELHDLRALDSAANFVKMPNYIADLTNNVVNSAVAYSADGLPVYLNNYYQYVQLPVANAQTTQYSAMAKGVYNPTGYTGQVIVTSLGNLHAGDPASKMQNLVSKWFYGMDLPQATYGIDNAGSLFGTGVSYSDIKQGEVGDCYFMSALGVMANDSPSTITNMFIDNGDGTYIVRLYDNGAPFYVTVNRMLPEDSSGKFIYADFGKSLSDPSAKLWAPLLEKAYAQVNAFIPTDSEMTKYFSDETVNPGIVGGWAGNVFGQTTGLLGASNIPLDQTKFTQAVDAGQFVCLSSQLFGKDPAQDVTKIVSVDGFTVVAQHEYAVLGHIKTTNQFLVFNPWGIANGGASDLLLVSYKQITDMFSSWDAGINPTIPLTAPLTWTPGYQGNGGSFAGGQTQVANTDNAPAAKMGTSLLDAFFAHAHKTAALADHGISPFHPLVVGSNIVEAALLEVLFAPI